MTLGELKLALLIINYTSCWVLELSCVLWQDVCVLENTGVLEIGGNTKSHHSLPLLPFLWKPPDVGQAAVFGVTGSAIEVSPYLSRWKTSPFPEKPPG